MNIKYLVFYTICFLMTNCSQTQEPSINQTYKFKDIYTFEEDREIKFPLDSVTSYYSGCRQYFTYQKDTLLAVENSSKNRIYLYDFNSKKLLKFIQFQNEGPQGIGKMEGFYIHTQDSIFVPSTSKQAMFLLNQKGRVLEKYPYHRKINKDLTQIFFTSQTLPTITQNILYCLPTSFGGTKENPKNAITLNLKTKKWQEQGNIPSTYEKGFFGATNFYKSYYTYHPDKDIYVHSFPIDNDVYTYTLQDSSKQYYAGSYLLKDVLPLSDNPFNVLFEERSKYFRQSPSYIGIYYDKYRKLYYRIAQQPIGDELINDSDPLKRGHKHFSIIILNEDLKKVGEYELKEKYTYGETIIPIPEGILLINFKKCQQNEDFVYYDLFKIVKKNEK